MCEPGLFISAFRKSLLVLHKAWRVTEGIITKATLAVETGRLIDMEVDPRLALPMAIRPRIG